MTRSPTAALLWEIWHRYRGIFATVIALTAVGRVFEAQTTPANPSVFVELLQMVSFILLFGIFSYTEAGDGRALGRFPRRLFVLPMSSLRLVAVPVVAGIVSVELLYLLWLDPRSMSAFAAVAFTAVLLGALMICAQAAIWTLDRLGPLRLVVVGLLVVLAFWISLLPSSAPTPAPWWRSDVGLMALIASVALLVFIGTWQHIDRVRSGSGYDAWTIERVAAAVTSLWPRRRRVFRSPAAAQFWFEWRCSGMVLPLVVFGVLVTVVAPLSWLMRHDAGDSVRLLIGTLVVPILLAIPIGIGFAKPMFWSEDLALPPFIGVRPISDADIVAVKVRVAVASAAMTWLVVLAFVTAWFALWGNADGVSSIAIQLWAFHGHSVVAVYGLAVLTLIAGVLLTWRFLVSRLWVGLSGRRPLFVGSAVLLGLAVIAAFMFDATRLPGWLATDPAHMAAVMPFATAAVIVKYSLAAYAWRDVDAGYCRRYLLWWAGAIVSLAAFAVAVWNVVRIYVALDVYRFQSLLLLLVLLAVPLARVGFGVSACAANRHR